MSAFKPFTTADVIVSPFKVNKSFSFEGLASLTGSGIDVFEGENNGLILAEIELYDEDEKFKIPSWIGLEVSDDIRYYNSQLIKSPFTAW